MLEQLDVEMQMSLGSVLLEAPASVVPFTLRSISCRLHGLCFAHPYSLCSYYPPLKAGGEQ